MSTWLIISTTMLNENKWLSHLLLGSVVENPLRIMFADSELGVCG